MSQKYVTLIKFDGLLCLGGTHVGERGAWPREVRRCRKCILNSNLRWRLFSFREAKWHSKIEDGTAVLGRTFIYIENHTRAMDETLLLFASSWAHIISY